MKKGSEKQKQIYDYIVSFSREHGYPPSIREIGAHVGLSSPATVYFHLKSLREAGLISQETGKTRTIKAVQGDDNCADHVPVVQGSDVEEPLLDENGEEIYLIFDTHGMQGEHFAMRMEGNSMQGAGILSGDLVVVHRQEKADDGDIVAAVLRGRATVKSFKEENGHVWLCPKNRRYKPINGDNARILGKVTAVVRQY